MEGWQGIIERDVDSMEAEKIYNSGVTTKELVDKFDEHKATSTSGENGAATALWLIGLFTYAIAVFAPLFILTSNGHQYALDAEKAAQTAQAFTFFMVGGVSGTVFLGFAEVIKLLDKISKK